MAVVFGASTNLASGTGTRSWSSPNTATPAGAVVVIGGGAIEETSGVTYGGVTMERVVNGTAANTGGETGTISTWYLDAPPGGVQTVEITRSGATAYIASVATVTSVTGHTAIVDADNFTSTSTNTAAVTLNLDSTAAFIIGGIYSGENALASITNGAGQTLLQETDFGNFVARLTRVTTIQTGASFVYTFTQSADDAAVAAVAIKEGPAVVSGSFTLNAILRRSDAIVLADSFTEASDTGIQAHTADIGGQWSGTPEDFGVIATTDVLAANAVSVGSGGHDIYVNTVQAYEFDATWISWFETNAASDNSLGFGGRSPIASNTRAYSLRRRATGASTGVIEIVRDEVGLETVVSSLADNVDNTTIRRMRFRVTGAGPTKLQAKVWASGSAEPAAWSIDTTDNFASLQVLGYLTFVGTYENTANNAFADNLVVTATPYFSLDAVISTGAATISDDFTLDATFFKTTSASFTLDAVIDDGSVTTYATDTFTRSVSPGLGTADVGGTWTASSTTNVSVDGSKLVYTGTASRLFRLQSVSAEDVDIRVRFQATTVSGDHDFAVLGRVIDDLNYYRGSIRLSATGPNAFIRTRKIVGGTITQLGTEVDLGTWAANDWWWVRIQLEGTSPTTFRMKAWLDGSSEPDWQVVDSDSESILQAPGGVGLRLLPGAATTHADDLNATSISAGSTVTDDFTLDSVLLRTVASSATLDAVVFRTYAASASLDAVIFRTTSASATLDATVFKTTTTSFTLGAIFRVPGFDPISDIDGHQWFSASGVDHLTAGPGEFLSDYFGDATRASIWRPGGGFVRFDGNGSDNVYMVQSQGEHYLVEAVVRFEATTGNAFVGEFPAPWGGFWAQASGSNLYYKRQSSQDSEPNLGGRVLVSSTWGGELVRIKMLRGLAIDIGGGSFRYPYVGKVWHEGQPEPAWQDSWTIDWVGGVQVPHIGVGSAPTGEHVRVDWLALFKTEQPSFAPNLSILTLDAVLSKTISGSFSLDAILRKAQSASFALDATVFRTYQASATLDATVRRTEAASFTLDATLTQTTGGSFTFDAVLFKTAAASFSFDAIVLRTVGSTGDCVFDPAYFDPSVFEVCDSLDVTLDAVLVRTTTAAVTLDAVVLKTEARATTLDAVLFETTTATFTLDAVLAQGTTAGSFVLDAIVRRTEAQAVTLDAIVFRTTAVAAPLDAVLLRTAAASFTLDAVVLRSATQSAALDAILRRTEAAAFSLSAWLLRTEAQTATLDAVIFRTTSASFTLDAVVMPTTRLDAVIRRTESQAFALDAVIMPRATLDAIVRRTETQSTTLDAFIFAVGVAAFGLDAVVRREQVATFALNAVLQRTNTATFTLDSVVFRTQTGSFSTDAIAKRTATATLTLDAVTLRTASASFSLDATQLKTSSAGVTADAVIQAPRTAGFILDSVVLSLQQASVALDAVLQAPTTASISLDAVLSVAGAHSLTLDAVLEAPQVESFALDAILQNSPQGVLTLDALVRSQAVGSATIDAIVLRTELRAASLDAVVQSMRSGSFELDALISVVRTATFDLDAALVRTITAVFSTEAVLKKVVERELTVDAVLLATQAASLLLDAYVAESVFRSFVLDAQLTETVVGSFVTSAYLALPPSGITDPIVAILAAETITATLSAETIGAELSAETIVGR